MKVDREELTGKGEEGEKERKKEGKLRLVAEKFAKAKEKVCPANCASF